MTSPQLVGIYSPTPQCGKSAIAQLLQSDYEFVHVSFAGPIKRMLGVFLNSAGVIHDDVERLLYEEKDKRLPQLRVTPRHLMQTLGTEWARDCIGPDVWVDIWRHNAESWLEAGTSVVVDDMRFPNEWDAVHELGGECWKVTSTRKNIDAEHASEGALNNFPFQRVFTNDGTLTELRDQIRNQFRAEAILR